MIAGIGRRSTKIVWRIFFALVFAYFILMPRVAFAFIDEYTLRKTISEYHSSPITTQTDILAFLINENTPESYAVFYHLLELATSTELVAFRSAIENHGSGELLINYDAYVAFRANLALAQLGINPTSGSAPSEHDAQRFTLVMQDAAKKLSANMTVLKPEIVKLARSNKAQMALAFRNDLREKQNSPSSTNPLKGFGSGSALFILEEEGFSALLETVGIDDDETTTKNDMLIIGKAVQIFQHYAVLPALLYYENPDHTQQQRNIAGMAIMSLPKTEAVYKAVADAYCNGRFYPVGGHMAEAVLTWWGRLIQESFKGDENLVSFLSHNYLVTSVCRPAIIRLIVEINYLDALKAVSALNLSSLDSESIKALVMSFFPDEETKQKRQDCTIYCQDMQSKLLQDLFITLPPAQRERVYLVGYVDHMSLPQKSSFIRLNFSRMTDLEKHHSLELWIRFDPLTRRNMRDSMYPFCSDGQKTLMDEVASGESSGKEYFTVPEIEDAKAKIRAVFDRL